MHTNYIQRIEKESSIIEKFFKLNWKMIFMIVLISCIGFAMMYSVAGGNFSRWGEPQVKRFCFSLVIMLAISFIKIRHLVKYSYLVYFGTLMLLVGVELFGQTRMGATRWISVGGFNLQPSEIMKVAVVLALARYFHFMHYKDIPSKLYLVPPLLIILLPVGLILKQPDLGTALIIVIIGGMMFFATGVQLWKFGVVIALGLGSVPFLWNFLHEYQKNRIMMFLNPENDPLGAGYNIIQSQIAIGSGGVSGKGFMGGSQHQLNFLPEIHTDFIFTTFAEEFGLIGSAVLISLYAILLLQAIIISLRSTSHFGKMLALGIATMFFVHIFVNMGMVMGMMPVVGAPLPLMSYGGTIMVTIMAGFGLILNVHLNRDKKVEGDIESLNEGL